MIEMFGSIKIKQTKKKKQSKNQRRFATSIILLLSVTVSFKITINAKEHARVLE